MDKNIRYLSGAVMCAAGGTAMKMFLISEKWATIRDLSYVQDGHLISAHPFNIGYHWTTCLGMMGAVLLIRGVMQILSREEKYPAGSAAASLFLGNICAWDLFDSISETYYGLFLGWDNRVMDICRILQAASFLAAAALVCVIFWRRGERKNGRTYQLLADSRCRRTDSDGLWRACMEAADGKKKKAKRVEGDHKCVRKRMV